METIIDLKLRYFRKPRPSIIIVTLVDMKLTAFFGEYMLETSYP